MTETLERVEPENADSSGPATDRPRARWTRAYTIWLLIVLSLVPGVVIALIRDQWTALPAGVRAATYLTSVILIAAAVSLILMGGKNQNDT